MGQAVQLHECMKTENGTVKLSRNVGQLNLRLLTCQKGEDCTCTKAKALNHTILFFQNGDLRLP